MSSKITEVRIAITHVGNELSFESSLTVSAIKAAVSEAIASGHPLQLTDIRGHEIIVPADKIGYVEIGDPAARRVGFGAL